MKTESQTKQKGKLVPKLRFKGFDEEWENKRLKDLTNLITKGTTPKSFSTSGINYVKIEGLNGVLINKEKCLYIDSETHNKELKRSILQKDDVLFAIAGATVGKVALVTDDILPANTNQALAIIRLKDKNILQYALQILQSRVMKKYIYQHMSVGAQPNLNLEQMGDFRFSIPTLPEQQKIASFLSSVDEKLSQLTRKKELLAQYKKGVMQQLFSGKLRFKDENGKEFPKWEEIAIGDIFKFKQGVQAAVEEQFFEESENMVRFIRIVDLTKADEPVRYIRNPGDEHHVEEDDLFMVRYGNPGVVGFGFKGVIANNLFRILPIDLRTYPKYFKFYFEYIKSDLDALASSSTMPALNFGSLNTLKLRLPINTEQQKIATFLSSIDDKITAITAQISQTQSFKKGLLQQMFV